MTVFTSPNTLTPGQRVEVRFDIESTLAREYGTVKAVNPDGRSYGVKLDKFPGEMLFQPNELAALPAEGPRYNPSERCESGKRPHCTCDTCF